MATRELVPLSPRQVGRSARIARISELAEHEAPSLLTFLCDAGPVPGQLVEVAIPLSAGPVLELPIAGRTAVHLSADVATAPWVESPDFAAELS